MKPFAFVFLLSISTLAQNDGFSQFQQDISAVARVLNGLFLEVQFERGLVDVFQLLGELAEVRVEEEQFRKQLGKLEELGELEGLLSEMEKVEWGEDWDKDQLKKELEYVPRFNREIREAVDAIDAQKIEKYYQELKRYTNSEVKNNNNNPAGIILDALERLDSDLENYLTDVNLVKFGFTELEKLFNSLDEHKAIYKEFCTTFDDYGVGYPLAFALRSMNKEMYTILKMANFSIHFDPFMTDLKASQVIINVSTSLSDRFSILQSVSKDLNQQIVLNKNLTIGFPNGLDDMRIVGLDLVSSRVQTLLHSDNRLEQETPSFFSQLEGAQSIVSWWKKAKFFYEIVTILHESFNDWNNFESEEFDKHVTPEKTFFFEKFGILMNTSKFLMDTTCKQSFSYFKQMSYSCKEAVSLMDTKLRNASYHVFKNMKKFSDVLSEWKTPEDILKKLDEVSGFKELKSLLAEFDKDASKSLFTHKLHMSTSSVDLYIFSLAPNMKDYLLYLKKYPGIENTSSLIAELGTVREIKATFLKSVESVLPSVRQFVNKTPTMVDALKTLESSVKQLKTNDNSRLRRQLRSWPDLESATLTIGSIARSALLVMKIGKVASELRKKAEGMGGLKERWAHFELLLEGLEGLEATVREVRAAQAEEREASLRKYLPIIEKIGVVTWPDREMVSESFGIFKQANADSSLQPNISVVSELLSSLSALQLQLASYSSRLPASRTAFAATEGFFERLSAEDVRPQKTSPEEPPETDWSSYLLAAGLFAVFILVAVAASVVSWCTNLDRDRAGRR